MWLQVRSSIFLFINTYSINRETIKKSEYIFGNGMHMGWQGIPEFSLLGNIYFHSPDYHNFQEKEGLCLE